MSARDEPLAKLAGIGWVDDGWVDDWEGKDAMRWRPGDPIYRGTPQLQANSKLLQGLEQGP